MQQDYRYRAFISYSHADEAWAKWLHRALETYRVPSRLRQGDRSDIPKRLFPIFRDRDELPSAAELGSVIEQALRQSEALIVVCSPRAAQSRWVNEEIRYFKSLGREHRVLALIVDGEPHASDAAQECFPSAVRFLLAADGSLSAQATEPIAADAREGRDGRRDALLKLIAGLLGVGFDALRQRERQRQFWQRVQQALAAAAVAALLVGGWQWFLRYERAQRLEQQVESLYQTGRLALLDQQMVTAALKLGEAQRLGRDTPALRFMLARALESVTPITVLASHVGGTVLRPAFSPDDSQFVTPLIAEQQSVAVVRDSASGHETLRLSGLPHAPQITRYLPDARRLLISGFEDSTAYTQRGATTGIWDLQSGQRLLLLPGHSGHFGNPFSADGQQLLTADEPDYAGVHLRDAQSGAVLRTLPHAAPARAASFSPDGRWVLTGDQLGVVRQWHATSGRLLRVLPGPTATAITGVVVTPDGARAVAISRKGDVRVWGLADGALQLAFAADKSFVADVRFDATGKRMLTIGRQGYKVWDLQRGTLLFARDAEVDWQASGDLDASGNFLVIATTDEPHAELWDVLGRRRVSLLQFESPAVTAAVFDHAGQSLLLAGETGSVALVRPLPGPTLQLAQPPSVYSASFSPDGHRIATVGKDQLLRLWDAASGAPRASGEGHLKRILQVLYSPDGARIATASDDGTIKLWRAGDATLLASATAHQAAGRGVYELMQSADGTQLLSIPTPQQAEDSTAKIWDARDLKLLHTLQHPAGVRSAVFSPDGVHIATACDDGVLRLWSRQSGQMSKAVALAKAPLLSVVYLPDGRSLITTDNVEHAERIDVLSGEVLEQFTASTSEDAPVVLAVAPDGRQWAVATDLGHVWVRATTAEGRWQLLSGGGHRLIRLRYLAPGLLLSTGFDGSIRAWDTSARAEEIAVVGGHDDAAWSLELDGAGRRLLSAGLDGTARLWRVDGDRAVDATALQKLRCELPQQLQAGAPNTTAPACP